MDSCQEIFIGGSRERTGPPMAPKITASAFLAAVSASSVNGEPVASIEAFGVLQHAPPRKMFSEPILTPPSKCSWKLNEIFGLAFSSTRNIYAILISSNLYPASLIYLESFSSDL